MAAMMINQRSTGRHKCACCMMAKPGKWSSNNSRKANARMRDAERRTIRRRERRTIED